MIVMRKWYQHSSVTSVLLCILLSVGCATNQSVKQVTVRPDVSPKQPSTRSETLPLDSSIIKPMYTEVLAIDLPSVIKIAVAQNFDILQAKQAVLASQGKVESTIGAAFPVIVPTALFEHIEGTVRATEGNLVGVGFNTFQPSVAIQWIINPGRVIYDIIASKKRLRASEHQERAVMNNTLRRSLVQFYDLLLTQTRVATAIKGVEESQELLRINRLRTRTGLGVLADELRAQARLSERQQELILSMKSFYDASVELSVTLHLDVSVTLIPSMSELPLFHLVRDDLTIEDQLGMAVLFRPDLEQVRLLVEVAAAETGSTWWGAWGPEFGISYEFGGISAESNNVIPANGIPGNLVLNPVSATGAFSPNPVINGFIREGILRGSRLIEGRSDQDFVLREQQRGRASVGWRLSLSAFGNLKIANARQEQSRLRALHRLDVVRAQVVTASQASKANIQLVQLAGHQVEAADEALRLSQANLQAGTMTTLDVLQSQDAAMKARLRHAEAIVNYNKSQVNLLAALGLIDEELLIKSVEN